MKSVVLFHETFAIKTKRSRSVMKVQDQASFHSLHIGQKANNNKINSSGLNT